MPESINQCPLCGSQQSRIFDRRKFRGHLVINRLCTNCGLVFQSPRMTEDELDAFYKKEYRQVYQGDSEPMAKDLFVQKGRAHSAVAFLEKSIPPPQRLLDIGASSGILLEFVQKKFGSEVVGIEPGDSYRAYAQERGLEVFKSIEEMHSANVTGFDLISMMHVLEHIPDPVGYLRMLREGMLSDEGFLLIEVPNLYAHDCFEIAHMTSFSVHTLKEVLGQSGYQIYAIEKHGYPRSNNLPLYITALAKVEDAEKKEVNPERFVLMKRKTGMLRRRILQKLFPSKTWIPLPQPSGGTSCE
ncbi:MAG: class I SAM-dependent methyltransferase [Anaerolineales bacterium]|nr:class I SAM-dependent methyltransferase [Anaerolineales bacterium]